MSDPLESHNAADYREKMVAAAQKISEYRAANPDIIDEKNKHEQELWDKGINDMPHLEEMNAFYALHADEIDAALENRSRVAQQFYEEAGVPEWSYKEEKDYRDFIDEKHAEAIEEGKKWKADKRNAELAEKAAAEGLTLEEYRAKQREEASK